MNNNDIRSSLMNLEILSAQNRGLKKDKITTMELKDEN
jgi:hypothetical protein